MKFLKTIAKQTEDLLAQYPQAKQLFNSNAKTFKVSFDKWKLTSDNQPQPYLDPSGSNGKDGYEYDEDDQTWSPVHTQKLPPDPTLWEIKDKLCCHYVTLGIIRDMIYADKTKPIVKNILQGTEAKTDAFSFVCYFIENANANKEIYSDESIELALSQVKQDLATKPAEIQQSQRTETPSEIELIEQFAEQLQNLVSIENCPKSAKAFNRWKIKLGDIINVDSFWKLADWLHYSDPPLDDGTLWKEAEQLWVRANNITAEQADNYKVLGPVDDLRGFVSDLAGLLLRRAEIAKQRLKPEKSAETGQKTKPVKKLSKVSKGKRVEEGEYDSCTWDEPLIQEQIKRIEEKFGLLANTLSELAELVREVDRWRNKPDPDHRDHPYKIVDATTIELLTSNVGDTFVFVPCEIYNVVICALTSARRLRPQIEMVVGTKDAAKFYYEELAQAVTFGANIYQATESIMISLENGGKAESVAQTLEQWDRNLLLLTRLDAKDSKQEIKPDKESKIKSRPTKPEMENRNRAVAMAAAKIKAEYDRLPTVDEIIAKTKYTRNQIYATNTYKEGKIAKSSAKLTTEMTGSSVAESEQFSRISEQHSRADRRSKSEQDELNALIDRQKK